MWYLREWRGEDDRWIISHVENEIRLAHRDGEHGRALGIISSQPLEAWFALAPNELSDILAAASPRQRRSLTPAHALDAYFRGDRTVLLTMMGAAETTGGSGNERARKIWSARQPNDCSSLLAGLLDALLLRRLGQPARAAARLGELLASLPQSSSQHEATKLYHPFIVHEYGVSLCLAGRCDEALRAFVSVQDASLPQLPFIVRDARVRAALIHAAFGDPRVARGHLDVAEELPRTGSWYEAVIDVTTRLAEALLAPPEQSLELLDRVPTHLIGEAWPFLVITEQILLSRANRIHEAALRLRQRSAAHPVPPRADGFIRSAFRLASAKLAIAEGAFDSARAHLLRADPELVFTQLFGAQSDLESGDTKSALLAATALADQTAELRRLDLVRVSIIAEVHLRRGRPAFAAEELDRAAHRWGGLTESDLSVFPAPVRRLQVLSKPQADDETLAHLPGSGTAAVPLSLTRRESEVLAELASGRNRKEIAARLFISENTVKSHQRSVFKKLNATTRSDAIGRAALLGLLSDSQVKSPPHPAPDRLE